MSKQKGSGAITAEESWRRKAARVVAAARVKGPALVFAAIGLAVAEPADVHTALEVSGLLRKCGRGSKGGAGSESSERLQLPLKAAQVQALLAAGTPAPYGRDADTLVDAAVRRATQVDASRVTAGPAWQQLMRSVSQAAVAGLGLADAPAGRGGAALQGVHAAAGGGGCVLQVTCMRQPGVVASERHCAARGRCK